MDASILGDANADLDVVLITSEDTVFVYNKPKGGALACQLRRGVYVQCLTRQILEGIQWIKTFSGWFCSVDLEKNPICEEVTDMAVVVESWKAEESKRKRMASAIACELVKSHPLPKVKRFVGSLTKHAHTFYPAKPMVKIKQIGMEDIMISLGGKLGLTKQQLFEYIKVTASQQSNPPQSVLDIIAEINHLITFRPTQWVVHDLNVLETEDVRRRNDRFVMLAASGKLKEFQEMVEKGQELTCLHSELKYTCLHGAADFGQVAVVEYIITTGVSLNMKDPRRNQTALHVAAYNGREGVVKALLAANADRKIGDKHGVTPYQYADVQGHFGCRELLKYLPPTVTDLQVTEYTISSITVSWKCPTINPVLHSEIMEFFVECLPEDLTAEESALLTPVPSSPPLPPLPTDLDRSLLKVKMDYIYQKYTNETITTVMFTNLIPSTTYCIRAKAFSVSGWSKFCRIVSQKTLAYVPDAPDPVDICKISTNGLLLSWYKPVRDNGMPVDFYQIELMDAKMAIPVMEQESGKIITGSDVATSDTVASPGHTGKFSSGSPPPVSLPGHHTAIGSHQGSQNSSHQHKHHRLQHKRLPTNPVKAGVASRFHRLLKHKNLQYLHKYLTGLEPFRMYQCRVRAHNSLGFSPWSGWTGPIAPQVGVTIASFAPERLSATLTWFAPLLSVPSRRVEAYEFQMCCLRGPLTKTIDLFTNEIASHLRTKAETGTANSNHDSNEHSSARDSGAGNKSRRRRQSDSGDSDSSGSESEDSLAWYSLELMDDGERLAESYKKTDNIVTSKTTKEDESNEYVTLCSNLQDNIYEVTGLKAGSRYKCRVRCKLNDRPDWNPWDSAVVSDIFSMPATPPDPPFMVRAAVSVAYSHTATTAAATAQEANFAATLLGSQEFIPRDTAHFDPPPSNISNDPAKAATIFDYDLSELEAMAPMIEVPLSEITPSGDDDYGFDGEPSETVLKRAPIPEFDPQNPLCGLEKSIKIRPNKTMSMSNSIMTQKNASSVYLSESERIGKESFGEEIEEGDRDGDGDGDAESRSVADSFSMSVQMQSVTSSVIARQTDVDIKSGLYVPGLHATSSAISTAPGLISAEASYSSTFLPAPVEEVQLDIMHDSITIAWQSGQANGLPVEEFVVECARVRTYRLVDVVRAKEAYQNVVETDEAVQEGAEDNSAVTNPVYGSPARKRLAQPASLLLEDGAEPSDDNDNNTQKDPVDCWEWEDITHTGGYFTEFQKFKATNLTPGCTYIFRVKQRNACGWSVFSGSSRMIATYPSVPPGVPAVFAVRNTYAAVRWAESAHPGIGLTNLEYDVQLGIVPPVLLTDQRDSSQDPRVGAGQDQGVPVSLMGAKRADPHKTAWSTVEVRYFPEEDQLLRAILRETATGTSALPASVMSATRSSDKKTAIIAEAGEGETFVHVMLPRLISHVTYIIRVRVRTVVGWSPWSEISAPFRTQS